MFSLLKLTFSLLLRPRPLPLTLQSNVERSPTDVLTSYSFGKLLSPSHFRRRITRTVSYYALLKDCCFWANLLIVSAIPPPLPLSNYLGALASNLGCFPLDTEAYPPMSHWLTKRLSIQSLP